MYALLIILGLGGVSISAYIYLKKRSHKKLVCPVGAECDSVIHSEYSRFFGIPVETLGLFYYSVVIVFYFFTLFKQFPPLSVSFIMVTITFAAFLFSVYLTIIQAFILKNWCSWCIFSAVISTAILILTLYLLPEGITSMLAKTKNIIVIVHLVGAALGLATATIADIFFFRFLKDLRISKFEASILKNLSEIIWVALGILIISGVALYIPHADELNASPKFWTKMIIVLVIIINGVLLNLVVSPKLIKISFGGDHSHKDDPHNLQKLAFALGAISITSWYSAFILGALPKLPIPFFYLITAYLGLLAIAIYVSQIMERKK